ncbi:MAG TPA: hypothetical protein VH306_00400 [Gaiellaceae bacterium]|jgi:hypothetical protein
MGVVVSLILIAVGAILAFAVTATVSGIDLDTVGVILMIVGGVGLLLSLAFWSSFGGYGVYRRETYVREDPYDRPPY